MYKSRKLQLGPRLQKKWVLGVGHPKLKKKKNPLFCN